MSSFTGGQRFGKAYRRYVVGGISLIVVEALLILGLLWQRARRRSLENELAISNDRIRLTVEVGRSVGVGFGPQEWTRSAVR